MKTRRLLLQGRIGAREVKTEWTVAGRDPASAGPGLLGWGNGDELDRVLRKQLDRAAELSRRRRMAVGTLDGTGQQKHGSSAAGVNRQCVVCAVHACYVRGRTGHVLAREGD